MVAFHQLPTADYAEMLRGFGFSSAWADGMVEMFVAQNAGFYDGASSPASTYDVQMVDEPQDPSPLLAPGEREDINRIAAAHGARNVRVFGSVRRGEPSASSDLDLLVDMSEGRSLLDLVALGDDLEEALGITVDVVTEKSLSPYLRDRILAEAVAL